MYDALCADVYSYYVYHMNIYAPTEYTNQVYSQLNSSLLALQSFFCTKFYKVVMDHFYISEKFLKACWLLFLVTVYVVC